MTLPGIVAVTDGSIDEFRSSPRLALREKVAVDLGRVLAWAGALAPAAAGAVTDVGGSVAVDATVGGTPADLRPAGTVVLKGVSASLPGRPHVVEGLEGTVSFDERHVKASGLKLRVAGVPVTAGFEVAGLALSRPQKFTPNGLVPRFEAALPGVTVNGSAGVSGWPAAPRYAFTLKTGVDLAPAWKLATGLGAVPPGSPLESAGSIAADTTGAFSGERLSFKTTAVFKDVSVRHRTLGPLAEGVGGTVTLTEDRCSIPALQGAVGGQPFGVTADLTRLGLAQPAKFSVKALAPKGKLGVSFAKLDADRLLAAVRGPQPPAKAPAGSPAPAEPEPDLRGVVPAGADIEFELRADELTYGKLVLTQQRAKVRVAGGRAVWSEEGRLYGGSQSANGTAVLESYPLKHETTLAASGVAAGPFLDAAADTFQAGLAMKGKLSGTASLALKATGEGVRPPAMRKTLVASGDVTVADGRLTGTEFLKGGLGKVLRLDWLGGGLAFRRLGGPFTLAQGVVTTSAFGLDPGEDGDLGITYKGTADFDARLKGTMVTRFHPRRAEEVSAGEVGKALFTKDANGWAAGEWDVAGTASLPILTPSKRQLGKRAAEVVKEKIAPKLEDEAKKAFKKLFGK